MNDYIMGRLWSRGIFYIEFGFIFYYCREMMEYFEGSKMIAFFHANPMKRSSFHSAWQVGVYYASLITPAISPIAYVISRILIIQMMTNMYKPIIGFFLEWSENRNGPKRISLPYRQGGTHGHKMGELFALLVQVPWRNECPAHPLLGGDGARKAAQL